MKIAVCVPCAGAIKAKTAICLADLMATTAAAEERPILKGFVAEVGPLELKRTQLVNAACAWGADFLLFVDSDQTFAPGALLRLLSHQKPVVGCNYLTRHDVPMPTAIDGDNERIWPKGGALEEVAALGLGFCLIHTGVFNRLRGSVLFQSTISPAGELVCGEDVHFFNLVRAAGVPVFLDHSLVIGHLTETIRTFEGEGVHADTVLPKAGAQ